MEKISYGIRGSLKFTVFMTGVFLFFVVSLVIYICSRLLGLKEPTRRRFFSTNTHIFCRIFLTAIGIKITTKNLPQHKQALFIGNHMGYLDVMCLFAVQPSVFVTSVEMKETFGLGFFTELGGSIYVERRNRAKILEELKGMAERINEGFNVVLYPEATSSNGEQILPFKRTLPMSAAYAKAPIQPFVVNFLKIDDQPFSLKNRDTVCWYGDMDFLTSFWRLCCTQHVFIEYDFLPAFYINEDQDRAQLADQLHSMISAKFKPAKVSFDLQMQNAEVAAR
ncbi:MAG: lysophospholipid acyltransferase family protein [Pseudobdellovibrionaceae bacterium]